MYASSFYAKSFVGAPRWIIQRLYQDEIIFNCVELLKVNTFEHNNALLNYVPVDTELDYISELSSEGKILKIKFENKPDFLLKRETVRLEDIRLFFLRIFKEEILSLKKEGSLKFLLNPNDFFNKFENTTLKDLKNVNGIVIMNNINFNFEVSEEERPL